MQTGHDKNNVELVAQAMAAWRRYKAEVDAESDAKTIEQALCTYNKQFALLWQSHEQSITKRCIRLLNSNEEGEDAALNIYILAHQNLGKLKANAAFLAWLNTMTRNYCAKVSIRNKRLPVVSLDDESLNLQNQIGVFDKGIEDILNADQLRAIQQRAIDELKTVDVQLVFSITTESDSANTTPSIAEWGRISGIAYSTVRDRLKYLKSWLDRIQKEELDK